MRIDELGIRRGDIIDGKYRIDGVLGTGGMAIVVSARHLQLDDRVAIKFLRRESLANPELVARFRREARAAVKLKGEHAARVTDVGQLANGTPFMVMEYLEGSDLAEWLRRVRRLPVEQTVEFILQASEALAEAHSLGIVHRDLKPANLFVSSRPDGSQCIKVLDFGISKRGPGLAASDITHASMLMGSPLYMSPEQLQSARDVDARSDIWALGVILYELLTGEPPFVAETIPQLVHLVVSCAPTPLRLHRAEIPVQLETLVLKCLEKDRASRFENVAAFALALSVFGPGRMRTSAQRVSDIMATAQRRSEGAASTEATLKPRPAVRFWPHAATITGRRAVRYGMGAAAVLATAAFFWVRFQPLTPPAATIQTELPPSLAPADVDTKSPAQLAAPTTAIEVAPTAVPAGPAAAQEAQETAKPPRTNRRSRAAINPTAGLTASTRPTTGNATTAAPAVAAREPEPSTRDRDASVSTAADDPGPLKKKARRGLDLADPFR